VLDMAATRTQVYLTKEQRAKLDELGRRGQRTLAELIREAVDRYLEEERRVDPNQALETTFGACPNLEIPDRGEWNRDVG
jgi:metal-responsive CopG/Arc/MetJ family transcriptional regulator